MFPHTLTDLPDDAFLRRPSVEAVSGLPRSTLYDAIKRGDFPKPEKLTSSANGRGAAGWRVGSIRAWLKNPAGWSSNAGAAA